MATRVYELCLTDGEENDGVPDHFEEEDDHLEHLNRMAEAEGLSAGEWTVRVLSSNPDATKPVGHLVGVIDAATVREHGEVREEELTNPLR